MWEYQLAELPKHNLYASLHDQRGFANQIEPKVYDYDAPAWISIELITQLNLS
jgi:hypothetical protein